MSGKIMVSMRIERELWEKFGQKVKRYGSNRSKMLRTMIRYFVGERENSEWLFVDENG